MYGKTFITLVFLASSGVVPAEMAWAEDGLSEAQYLSFGCNGCHIPGAANGKVPQITGKPVDEVVNALMAYRNHERTNDLMRAVSTSLDEAQIKALAAYLQDVQP